MASPWNEKLIIASVRWLIQGDGKFTLLPSTSEIWDCHIGEDIDYGLLGCDAI
jgi:hypothetical protein